MATRAPQESPRKNERIGLRASEQQRALLLAASQAEGTTVSDFILRHATRAAEDVLADRRVFMVATDVWNRFAKVLERPATEVAGLNDLMAKPTVLDQD